MAKDKPSGRKAAISEAVNKLGGKLDAIYFCLGENDVILILDMPDHVCAVALGSAACASGMARTKTTVLLTIDEADAALSKPVAYRAPGA
ncbi:MAG: GYD domain-containing protein [Candidatus Solibacter sp.]